MPRPHTKPRQLYVPKMIILHHRNGQLGNPFSDREIDQMFPRTVRLLFPPRKGGDVERGKGNEKEKGKGKEKEVPIEMERGDGLRKRKREETGRVAFWDGDCLRSRSTGKKVRGM